MIVYEHDTQRAATVLHQTAETSFKDLKCHFVVTAFIYASINFFFEPNTAYSQALSNILPWSSFLILVTLFSAFLHFLCTFPLCSGSSGSEAVCSHLGKLEAYKNYRTFQAGENCHSKFLLALCVLLHSQRWFLHNVPPRCSRLADSVGNLGLFQWGSMVSLGLLRRERAEAQICVTVSPHSEPMNTAASCFSLQHRWGFGTIH